MSIQTRLADLITAIGADIKLLKTPSFVSGFYTGPLATCVTGVSTINRLCFFPLRIDKARPFDRISSFCTVGVAGAVLRYGVYEYNPLTGLVGALLDDLGTVDASTSSEKALIINKTYGPGWVALAVVAQGGTPTMYMTTPSISGVIPSINSVMLNSGYFLEGVTGPLPVSVTPQLLNTSNGLHVALRSA